MHYGEPRGSPARLHARRKNPRKKNEHSDGVNCRELDWRQCFRRPELPAIAAHPCLRKGGFSHYCNTPCTKLACGADVARRRRRHGQGFRPAFCLRSDRTSGEKGWVPHGSYLGYLPRSRVVSKDNRGVACGTASPKDRSRGVCFNRTRQGNFAP